MKGQISSHISLHFKECVCVWEGCVCVGGKDVILFHMVSGHEDYDWYNRKMCDWKWLLKSRGIFTDMLR